MAQHEIRVKITADGSKAIAESGKVKGELKGVKNVKIPNPFGEVSNGAKKASSDVDALGGALGKIRNMVAGAFAVGSIYSFGKAALSAAAKTELLHKGLSFVLNSDEEASRLVKTFRTSAKRLPMIRPSYCRLPERGSISATMWTRPRPKCRKS